MVACSPSKGVAGALTGLCVFPACQDGGWRVGEGVCCLTTPTHAYIARLKPSCNDLVMLFSIPQPQAAAQQPVVPVAAWLPHSRPLAALPPGPSTQAANSSCSRPQAQHVAQQPLRVLGDVLMPCAVLALGWGTRLVLFEVPLLGDQLSAEEVGSGG